MAQGQKRKATRQVARPRRRARMGVGMRLGRQVRPKFGYGVFRIKRWINPNPVTLIGSDATGGSGNGEVFNVTFNLNQCPSVTEFTTLFDQYMLSGVKYRFVLSKDITRFTTAGVQGAFPFLTWVHDFDGQVTTSIDGLRQYASCRELQFTQNQTRSRWFYIRPASQTASFLNLTSSAYGPQWNKWIDVSYPSVPHYGVSGVCTSLFAGVNISMEAIFYLRFKGVR